MKTQLLIAPLVSPADLKLGNTVTTSNFFYDLGACHIGNNGVKLGS